jgi:hypothetical protein
MDTRIREGYILYNPKNNFYLDANEYEEKDFMLANIYDKFDKAKDAIEFLDEPQEWCVQKIHLAMDVIAQYNRRIVFSEADI